MAQVLRRWAPPRATAHSGAALTRAAGRFGLHLLELCLAMGVGVAVLDLPFLALFTWAGSSDPIRELPEIAVIVVAFNMSLSMALWMWFRGHDQRCGHEMSGALFVEAFVLIGAAWLGVLSRDSLVLWQHSLMLPAMVVSMLYRIDIYTAPAHRMAHP